MDTTISAAAASLVHKRIQDILIAHETTLSNLNLSSLEHRDLILQEQERKNSFHKASNSSKQSSQSSSHQETSSNRHDFYDEKDLPNLSLAQSALYRTFNTQPPFQKINHSHNYDPNNNLIIDLNLNPPERVSPQDLLIHDKRRPTIPLDLGGHSGPLSGVGGGGDGLHNVDISSLTLKTITVLSTLCDEAHELYDIAKYKLIPKLYLFAHDLKHGEFMINCEGGGGVKAEGNSAPGSSNQSHVMRSTSNNTLSNESNNSMNHNDPTSMNFLLDENVLVERDSKLLHRMSKFITNLQSTQNYVQRCHRLIRNIICQIHGCLSPIVLSHNESDHGLGFGSSVDEDMMEEDDSETKHSGRSNASVPKFIGNRMKKTSKKEMTATSKKEQQPEPTLPPIFRQSNHLMFLGEAIAKLLSTLITLDAIIGNNYELHEAWDLYKSIVTERAEKLEESLAAQNAASASVVGAGDEVKRQNVVADEFDNDDEYRSNLISLERMIMEIDFTLLSSRSFLICIEQNFDPRGRFCFNPIINRKDKDTGFRKNSGDNNKAGSKNVYKPKPLHEHIKNIVSSLYEWYCSVIHTNEESTERYDMVGIYGLYCLYRRLLPSNKEPDEKLHRAFCTIFPTTYPIIPLYGNIPFMPVDFISKYAPLDTSRTGGRGGRTRAPRQSEIIDSARSVLDKIDKTFNKKVTLLFDEAMAWSLRAESELAPLERSSDTALLFDDGTNDHADIILTPSDHQNSYEMNLIKQKSEIVLMGMMIANQASILLQTFLFLHTFLRVQIEPKHIHRIKQLCYIAKSIEKVLAVRRRDCVVSMNKAVLRMLASSLYSCFDKLRSYIDQRSVDHGRESPDQVHASTISTSLWALESILKGSSTFSPSRRYAMEVAVYVCSQESFSCITNEDKKSIRNLMNQIKWMSEIDDKLNQACDCSFLYFNKDIYPALIKNLFTGSEYQEVEEIHLMMSAFADASKTLRAASYFSSSSYEKRYREFVIDNIFYQEFIKPLCFKIEASLRLLLFSRNLDEIMPVNPKEQRFGRFKKYIEMQPLHFCGITISVKKAVERYLERSFYNFATIGLRDSKTYSEMATLGNELYGLNLIDNLLPKENIQGVDFTEILNINLFIKRYNYNMVQQNFIERKVNNGCKYLKTLGIETISYSFQRHGLGMAKTVTDEVKTCLYGRVKVLSTIFEDNMLRSLLSKESRWNSKVDSYRNTSYSLDRASIFRKEIAELGDNDENVSNLSILEKCKECVTLIGNLLGMLRLIQSGKMYTINQSTTNNSFFSSVGESSIEKEASLLEEITNQFRSEVKTEKDDMSNISSLLEHFFILFPVLSLAWLDTSIRGKDMLSKKYQTFDAYYTDDGFAMGSAFILEVLDQSTSLDKLNWFESSCVAYASNRKDIIQNLMRRNQNSNSTKKEKSILFGAKNEESKQSKNSDDESLRLRVAAKRLEVRKQEMELLHYTVLGARVFFSSN